MKYSRNRLFPCFFAGALALMVIYGWFIQNSNLIQVHPSFVPMQFNTALCMLASAIGISFMLMGKLRLAQKITSLSLILLTGLTILQYMFHWNLGIDELFFDHYITVKTSHPGRMAPSTATSFFMLGILLLIGTIKSKTNSMRLVEWVLAFTILALSFVALVGYISGVEVVFGWQKFTRMAVHTALGVFALSVSAIWHIFVNTKRVAGKFLYPMIGSLSMLIVFVILGQTLKRKEEVHISKAVDAELEFVYSEMNLLSEQVFVAFQRLSNRMVYKKSFDKDFWTKDAENYLRDFKFYQAIEWVDEEHVVRWVVPLKGNEKLLGFDNKKSDLRLGQFELAKKTRLPITTDAFPLVQGGMGFLYINPLFYKDEYKGSSLAVFNAEKYFNGVLDEINREYIYIEVVQGDKKLYSSSGFIDRNSYGGGKVLSFLNDEWSIQVYPTQKLLDQYSTQLPEVIIFFGLVISLFVGGLIMLIQRSISHQRHAEALAANLQKAKQKLELKDKYKTEFLANMSHELRTPLNAIIGYSEILMEETAETNTDMISDLRKIEDSGKYLLNIINNILDISKIESGHMDVFIESTNLEDLVSQVVELVDPIVRRNNNQLKIDMDKAPESCDVDVTKMKQVLVNLISNAAKFTKGGTVSLRFESNDSKFQIQVSDTGIGIPKNKLEHIFGEFNQVDGSSSKSYVGTGLGLSISKKFVEIMGGHIEVTSELGKGSTFTVVFPLRSQVHKEKVA